MEASTPEAPYRLDAAFGPATPAAVVERYARDTRTVPPAASLADWRACDGFDVRERLAEFDLPVLVVWGAADRLTVPKH